MMKPRDMKLIEDGALAVNKKTREQIEAAPDIEVVWGRFAAFCKQYNLGGKSTTYAAPIPCGHNVIGFDNVIANRMCEAYGFVDKNGKPTLFNNIYVYDTLQLCNYWLGWQKDPAKLNLNALREYFGISTEGSHDALKDVLDTAGILQRLLKLTRRLQDPTCKPNIKFKGSFAQG